MTTRSHDPSIAPDPAEWLALDESARTARVEQHHRNAGETAGNMVLHATIHAIVENQIALNDPPEVARKLRSLVAGGLDRHQAVHALGTAVTEMILAAPKGQAGDPVRRLTVKKWLRMGWGGVRPLALGLQPTRPPP